MRRNATRARLRERKSELLCLCFGWRLARNARHAMQCPFAQSTHTVGETPGNESSIGDCSMLFKQTLYLISLDHVARVKTSHLLSSSPMSQSILDKLFNFLRHQFPPEGTLHAQGAECGPAPPGPRRRHLELKPIFLKADCTPS